MNSSPFYSQILPLIALVGLFLLCLCLGTMVFLGPEEVPKASSKSPVPTSQSIEPVSSEDAGIATESQESKEVVVDETLSYVADGLLLKGSES